MSEIASSESRLTRRHHHRLRYDKASGCFVGVPLSGRILALMTRLFAPNATETRQTILALRRDFQFSRGQLAALLATTEATVKAWERGKRAPSLVARRLIWFMDNSLRDKPDPGMDGLIRWNADASDCEDGGEVNAASEQCI